MYTSNDLTLSMFYSSAIAEETGNKVATLTVQTMGPSAEILQISKLHCITDENKRNVIVLASSLLLMAPTLFSPLSKPGGVIILRLSLKS